MQITGVAAANRWLAHVYLPEHNARFAQPAEQQGSAVVPDRTGAWRDILCVQDERIVGNDNSAKWKRLSLQIPPSPLRPHFVRAKVRIHEHPDGRLAVFWDRTGSPTTTRKAKSSMPVRWRLNRFGRRQKAVDLWATLSAFPTTPPPQPPQKRTIDVLQTPTKTGQLDALAKGLVDTSRLT